MKRFTMLKASLCALCLVVALSCSENKVDSSATPIPQNLSSEKVKVVNGVLVFANQQEFDNTVTALRNKDSKVLDEWETQFTEFTSIRKAYNSITEADMIKIGETQSLEGYENFMVLIDSGEDKEAMRIISSNAIATLFNQNGLVIINQNAYKYKFDKVLKMSKPSANDLLELAKPYPNSPKISLIDLERKINGVSIKGIKNGRVMGILNDHCLTEYWVGNSKRRIVGESNSNKNWEGTIFNSINCKAKHQRRLAGIWWAQDVTKISLSITSYLKYTSSGSPVPGLFPNPSELNDTNEVGWEGCNDCYGTVYYSAWCRNSNNDEYSCSESETAI